MKENEDRKSLIKKIEQELIFLNMEVLYNGVRYLIDAVYILYNLENYYDNNLEKDIYPIIAKKYHKTVNNIKSNINYTVNLIYAGCEEEKLLDYLEEYSICKPTPKKIIFSILEKIQRK